jgi:hypothetical protein
MDGWDIAPTSPAPRTSHLKISTLRPDIESIDVNTTITTGLLTQDEKTP